MQSSHDAAFIMKGDQYIGVINPYYSLIKHNKYDGDSEAKSSLYHPPRLTTEDSLERIVGLMIDSRLHYLPVMDGNKFLGVVSARGILAKMAQDQAFNKLILDALQTKNKPLVSVYLSDEINKVINLFESEDVSKLVVIDEKMKLQGIMSYYDIIPHLLVPTERIDARNMKSVSNLDTFQGLTVKNVAKSLVHTLTPNATLHDALQDIIKRSIGSVVIVNAQGFPVGIVTVRDLLQFLTRTEEELLIELSTNDISEANMQIIHDYGPKLERWVRKIPDLARATMLIKEEKNGKLFSVKLTLTPRKGKSTMYKGEGKNLLELLQKINKNN
jgi:CBS domain-containing protein